jgi:hypothetical protein
MNTKEFAKNSEQWASVDGYRHDQVSWFGRARKEKTGRILKGSIASNGYLSVSLYKKGKMKTRFIHAFVARE